MEPVGIGSEDFTIFVIPVLFLWLVSAYTTGTMASRKGYNFWLGFIGGIVAWIPTVIVLTVVQPKRRSIGVPSPTALKRLAPYRVCQVCGKANLNNAINCRKCGMALSFSNSSKTAVETMILTDDVREEVNEGRIRVCQRCGRLNSPKRMVCKSCGAEFAV